MLEAVSSFYVLIFMFRICVHHFHHSDLRCLKSGVNILNDFMVD